MSEAAEEKAPAAPAGIPMKMVIIIVAGVLVLALGGAFAMMKMMGGSSGEKAPAEGGADKAAGHGGAEEKDGEHGAAADANVIADLDPFIVNLADSPEIRYLKVTLKVEADSSGTVEQIKAWVKEPVAYRIEYADGLKATMLLMNGLVEDFTFAARIEGRQEPLSTLFQLPPNPNVVYSAALMSKVEEMFRTGRAPYPVERTLLTSGLVAAGMQSLARNQERIETPHLAIRYEAPRESQFWVE